jgi:hypothetical protein
MSVDIAHGAGAPPAAPHLDDGECPTREDPSGGSTGISIRLEASDRPGDVPAPHGVVTVDGPRSGASLGTWAERS